MRIVAAALFALAVAACQPKPEPDLNPFAEQYVRLSLEIGTHEEGYIDAYFGPPEWKTEAEANPRSIADLKTAVEQLRAQIDAAAEQARDPIVQRRAHTLSAYLTAAHYRMRMMEGYRGPFVEEAENLFALRPDIVPLEHYDAVIARIDALVPGTGPLSERIDAFKTRYQVPRDRAEAFMRAAIAECRRRTAEHIALPENERFDFEFVTGQPWGAYNWYQGDNHSLIQVNLDNPLGIASGIGYGCHEGYPGHHVQGIHAEKLYRENGWVEYSIMPLYSPQGPLNEGGGNYGEPLAFPGDEQMVFERDVLFPIAGLDPATAEPYWRLRQAMEELSGASRTIEAQYLDGTINREQAIELLQRYNLSSRSGAEGSLGFADHYRSYIINYSSGFDVVRAYAERAGDTQEARWAAYELILNEPTLPRDIMEQQ